MKKNISFWIDLKFNYSICFQNWKTKFSVLSNFQTKFHHYRASQKSSGFICLPFCLLCSYSVTYLAALLGSIVIQSLKTSDMASPDGLADPNEDDAQLPNDRRRCLPRWWLNLYFFLLSYIVIFIPYFFLDKLELISSRNFNIIQRS